MTGIKRRLEKLEEKTGAGREIKFILIRNYAKDNADCKGHTDTGLCHAFDRLKRNPRGMSESGFVVFRFPCKDCEEQYEP